VVILDPNPEGALVGVLDYGYCITSSASSSDKRGTKCYAPPEAFLPGNVDTEKFDVFMLGALLITIIFQDTPFWYIDSEGKLTRCNCINDPRYRYFF
jgi:hypothetical protein